MSNCSFPRKLWPSQLLVSDGETVGEGAGLSVGVVEAPPLPGIMTVERLGDTETDGDGDGDARIAPGAFDSGVAGGVDALDGVPSG